MPNKLGKHLSGLRESRGYTLTRLAWLMGIRPCSVMDWETDKSFPTYVNIVRYSKALDMDFNEVLDFKSYEKKKA